MKSLFFLIVFLANIQYVRCQCTGGYWPIQESNIGSFTVSWQYNVALNTVQFIIQGETASTIDLTATYLAIGWSDTTPTMTNMDVAMFFIGTQVVQDRFSRARVVPPLDTQQDFCVIRTNVTNRHVYVAFERFVTTSDPNDISFSSNMFLMFAVGAYTTAASSNNFQPRYHTYRVATQTTINLLNCTSTSCTRNNCTIPSCPCIQHIQSGVAQCQCFPPSPCVSGSTITPRPTFTVIGPGLSVMPVSTAINGLCQNQSNSCSPNGICQQISPTQYICQCQVGFTGLQCQTSLNLSIVATPIPCQCLNGGTCLSNGTCLCDSRFRGRLCQLSNPCLNYCRNNATCLAVCTEVACSTPSCNCTNGFVGFQCESVSTNPCQPNPCLNGNCIPTTNNNFLCQCLNGFSGPRCDFISSCLSNPCNQGTCIVSTNCVGPICGYACICGNGTSGSRAFCVWPNCEFGANPCLSVPCRNGATCLPLANTYICQCAPSFAGPNCDVLINVCTPNPCLNGGICIRSTNPNENLFRCDCPIAYVGARCEFLSGCSPSPCQNGGQCTVSTQNCSSSVCTPTCVCATGFIGRFCEQQDSSCLSSRCLNGGTCSLDPRTNRYTCQCPSNTTGTRCETPHSICHNTTCFNSGVCYVDASSPIPVARCFCMQGYTGQYCQLLLNASASCSQNPCGFNGTCISTLNSSYFCLCPNGFTGLSCGSVLPMSCSNFPCRHQSSCQTIPLNNGATYRCYCPDHLTGDRCQFSNTCRKYPCLNQGTCVPLGAQNSYMCLCAPGFGHHDCSVSMGLTCNSSVCLNGGTCRLNGSSIYCICPTGFTGARCEWSSVCSSNTCQNGGTCRQSAATIVECLCQLGFTGPTCSRRDSCLNFPCKNGGGCASLLTETGTNWSAYRCSCPPATFGQHCDQMITSCANLMCPSFQICNELSTGPVCTCSGNRVGTFCQYDNPCISLPSTYCSNGGTCVPSNTDPPIATCLCRDGFTGLRCNSNSLNDLCASNPCDVRGYCALSASSSSYACVCRGNFAGDQCERSNPCQSMPCLNQGICEPQWNSSSTWFACRCVGPFTGSRCETSALNPCSGLCMNESPCVNGICACSAQYMGTFCGFENPCFNPICRNGGFCSATANLTSVSFNCTCPSSFTGRFCETSIAPSLTATCSSPCLNAGTCVAGICVCPSRFIGPSCQYENPCNNRNPCLNSGTCFGRNHLNGTVYTQCFCLEGFTGASCETILCGINTCNGGTCIPSQNSFVCNCPTGRTGDRCQFIDLCLTNPCSTNELCQQTGSQRQCLICFDRSSFCSLYQTMTQYCNDRFILLVNNTALPVTQACPRSCGLCNPNSARIDFNDQSEQLDSFSTAICSNQRDDCELQKLLGFCNIFNENYPKHCTKTCDPRCSLRE